MRKAPCSGKTALTLATENGHAEVVEMLKKSRAKEEM